MNRPSSHAVKWCAKNVPMLATLIIPSSEGVTQTYPLRLEYSDGHPVLFSSHGHTINGSYFQLLRDLLRMAVEHPHAEVVGISDEQPARMEEAIRKLGIPRDRSFTDHRACLEKTKPDIVILCPAASKHGEWVKKVAPYGVHILVEK